MTWKPGFALALMLAGTAALPLPASAQQQQDLFSPPPPPPSPAQSTPQAASKAAPKTAPKTASPTGAPKGAQPKAAADSLVGTWTGPVTQVEHDKGFSIVVTVRPGGGDTEYPELNCSGKLTRTAGSGNYVFYLEKITRGRHDGGGRCPDGTVTIARAGDKLAFSWFATVDGIPVFAYSALSRK
jgi:hypothetical protein